MNLKLITSQANIKYLLPLTALAAGSRAFPLVEKIYYLLPFLLIYFIIVGIKEIRLNKTLKITVLLLLLFSVWGIITSFWSSYPLITITRSLYFALISIGSITGGFLYLKSNKRSGLNFALPLNIFIIFLSFISLIFKIPADAWTGGDGKGFMGFASHQNTLGALILFTIPASIWGIIKEVTEKAKDKVKVGLKFNSKFKIQNSKFLLLLLIFSFSFLIITYSRAAMLSLFVAALIYLFIIFKWKFILISSLLLTTVFCLLATLPSLRNDTWSLLKKGYSDPFFTRRILWGPSYKAAIQGGLIGIGYGISDPNIILTGTGSHYTSSQSVISTEGRNPLRSSVISTTDGRRNPQLDESTHSVISTTEGRRNPPNSAIIPSEERIQENGRYIREKGNSTLAFIEETGVVGLILFLLPLGYIIYELIRRRLKNGVVENILIFSFIIAFILHAQFEAWWVGVGSIELPLFFMCFGLAAAVISNPLIPKPCLPRMREEIP